MPAVESGAAQVNGLITLLAYATPRAAQPAPRLVDLLLRTMAAASDAVRCLFPEVTGEECMPEFDASDIRANVAARELARALMSFMENDAREALRGALIAELAAGTSPALAARRMQDYIGQTAPAIRAIQNLRAELLGSRPGKVVQRFLPIPGVRKRAGLRIRVPALHGAARATWADGQVRQYAARHLRVRARTIAHTETWRAANAGLRATWLRMIFSGRLSPEARRAWITRRDDRVRKDHRVMEGVTARVTEPFDVPDGSQEPGAAVACRCIQRLILT